MDLSSEQAKLFEHLHTLDYSRASNRDEIARLTAENQQLSSEIADTQQAIIDSVDFNTHEPMIYRHDGAYFVYNPHATDDKIRVVYDVWSVKVVRPSDSSDDAPIPF